MKFFDTVVPLQQRVFLRLMYYAELDASGLECNDHASEQYQSYRCGRLAIDFRFPGTEAYGGDITLFAVAANVQGGVVSGYVHTDFGGDISIYFSSDMLLGLSRTMPTFGGDILIGLAEGTQPRSWRQDYHRLYAARAGLWQIRQRDAGAAGALNGRRFRTPEPQSGGGARWLNLAAPLGTVDAGKVGTRISANFNIAALQIGHAANV